MSNIFLFHSNLSHILANFKREMAIFEVEKCLQIFNTNVFTTAMCKFGFFFILPYSAPPPSSPNPLALNEMFLAIAWAIVAL